MESVLWKIDSSLEHSIEELKEFCRYESVSADPGYRTRVKDCADWLAGHIRGIGFPEVEIVKTEGHPLVYARMPGPAGAPTILIYGHYDVQPVDPVDLWETPPFEPTIKDHKLFCRGATDDKGQVFLHLKAIQAWKEARGGLPVTIKILFEGEEEMGSENVTRYVHANASKLAADAVLVSDTSMFAPGIPAITYGLRGLSYFQIDLSVANTDMHSGGFGGAVANPANVLAEILASMKDPKTGRILIDGIYDDVEDLSENERRSIRSLPFDEEEYLKEIDAPSLFGEEGFTTYERTWCRPSLDINGIWGGYAGEGAKTVLPCKAGAKFSIRLVPRQDTARVVELVRAHVEKVCPKTVRCHFREIHSGKYFYSALDDPYMKMASDALTKGFGTQAVNIRIGGSIPVVAELSEVLKAPILLLGFGLSTEKAHAPNEHFHLENFAGGIRSMAYFYDALTRK